VSLDQLLPSISGLVVPARLVERDDRRPDLEAVGLIDSPRRPADGDDRRRGLLGERGALDTGGDEDQRARGRVDLLGVDLEPRAAVLDEVELLFPVVLGLVVLVDDLA